jgi:hypothetical protein
MITLPFLPDYLELCRRGPVSLAEAHPCGQRCSSPVLFLKEPHPNNQNHDHPSTIFSLCLFRLHDPFSDHLSRRPYDALKTCNPLGPSPCQCLSLSRDHNLESSFVLSHSHHIGDGGNSSLLDHNLWFFHDEAPCPSPVPFHARRGHGHDPVLFPYLFHHRDGHEQVPSVSCLWWKHHLLRPPHVTFPANRAIRKWGIQKCSVLNHLLPLDKFGERGASPFFVLQSFIFWEIFNERYNLEEREK